jgi:two-component system chemotaxis response regulator CheY
MKKIVIIDDEIKLREALVELFSFIGYEIIEAQDGLEGLEKVDLHIPDLILCDVMMPNLDGYGFLKKHGASKHASIPVLLLTAKIEEKDEITGSNLGAKGYIKKPFSFQELKRIIEKHI